MTIEKSLRHAVAQSATSYDITPAPQYRWTAASTYISSSGSPARAQIWSASIGGIHLIREGSLGPKVDDIPNQGVFFDETVTHIMSSSVSLPSNGVILYHAFLVLKCGTGTADEGVPIGFTGRDNHYILYRTTTNNVTFSHSGSTDAGTYFWGTILSNITIGSRYRNNQRNVIGLHYRVGVVPYETVNSASVLAHSTSTGTPNLFFIQQKVLMGRRQNTAYYSGSIYDILLYSNSLTDAETGSIINQLNDIWGVW